MDNRIGLLREYQLDLERMIGADAARIAVNMLSVRLDGYEVTKAQHALIAGDDETQMMLRAFLASKKLEGRTDRTLERYRYVIQRMISAVGLPVRDYNVFVLRKYLAQLELHGSRLSTVDGIRSIMRSFFGWLRREELIPSDPAEKLCVIRQEQVIRKAFTQTDIDSLRTACGNLRDRALLEFLRSTGARIDEVCRLNTEDIDWLKKECTVRGKGGKHRTVYIDDVCMMRLRDYLQNRKADGGALFAGRGSDRMTAGGVRAMLHRIGDAAGVEDVHPHKFRRTLATNLISRGMPIQDVARILGHSQIDTTMIYVEMDDRAVEYGYRKFST